MKKRCDCSQSNKYFYLILILIPPFKGNWILSSFPFGLLPSNDRTMFALCSSVSRFINRSPFFHPSINSSYHSIVRQSFLSLVHSLTPSISGFLSSLRASHRIYITFMIDPIIITFVSLSLLSIFKGFILLVPYAAMFAWAWLDTRTEVTVAYQDGR